MVASEIYFEIPMPVTEDRRLSGLFFVSCVKKVRGEKKKSKQ